MNQSLSVRDSHTQDSLSKLEYVSTLLLSAMLSRVDVKIEAAGELIPTAIALGAQLLTESNPRVVPKNDEEAELFAKDISLLRLRTKIENTLRRHDVITISDLMQKTQQELLSFTGFGHKFVNEITMSLYDHNLRIKHL